jgi:hypothetical protein
LYYNKVRPLNISPLPVDVAAGRDGEPAQSFGRIARFAVHDQVVGDDERAEAGRQRNRAIVGMGSACCAAVRASRRPETETASGDFVIIASS